ncbi:unnamed protein product [Triticum turgidum subsp. durum]|uniref:Uncharacterized protein n=1 Tax=Triticum turgidum subsp. durum TaxID=4567 RepID=A0A9R0TJQ3_TRITD|nr:unnamed protein product [Triticum turgidum subsp. durum]
MASGSPCVLPFSKNGSTPTTPYCPRVTVWCDRGFFHYDPSCPASSVAPILLPLWDSSCLRELVQAINTCDYDMSTSGHYSKRSKHLLDLISVRFGLCIVPDFVIRIWYIIITDEEEKGFIVSGKTFRSGVQ